MNSPNTRSLSDVAPAGAAASRRGCARCAGRPSTARSRCVRRASRASVRSAPRPPRGGTAGPGAGPEPVGLVAAVARPGERHGAGRRGEGGRRATGTRSAAVDRSDGTSGSSCAAGRVCRRYSRSRARVGVHHAAHRLRQQLRAEADAEHRPLARHRLAIAAISKRRCGRRSASSTFMGRRAPRGRRSGAGRARGGLAAKLT